MELPPWVTAYDDQTAALLGDEMAAQINVDNGESLLEWLKCLIDEADAADNTAWFDLQPEERKYLLLLAMVGLRRSIEWAEKRRASAEQSTGP